MSFKRKLMEALEDNNMNQTKLAKELNMSLSTLNGYVNGRRQPSLDIIREICSVLNISADYLLEIKSDKEELSISEIEYIRKVRRLDENTLDIIKQTIDRFALLSDGNEETNE